MALPPRKKIKLGFQQEQSHLHPALKEELVKLLLGSKSLKQPAPKNPKEPPLAEARLLLSTSWIEQLLALDQQVLNLPMDQTHSWRRRKKNRESDECERIERYLFDHVRAAFDPDVVVDDLKMDDDIVDELEIVVSEIVNLLDMYRKPMDAAGKHGNLLLGIEENELSGDLTNHTDGVEGVKFSNFGKPALRYDQKDVDTLTIAKRNLEDEANVFKSIEQDPWKLIVVLWQCIQAVVLNYFALQARAGFVVKEESDQQADLRFLADCSAFLTVTDLQKIESAISNELGLRVTLYQRPVGVTDTVLARTLITKLSPERSYLKTQIKLSFGAMFLYCVENGYRLVRNEEEYVSKKARTKFALHVTERTVGSKIVPGVFYVQLLDIEKSLRK
jgi:hypothetical protein